MGLYIDLDSAVADHPEAKKELAELRERLKRAEWEVLLCQDDVKNLTEKAIPHLRQRAEKAEAELARMRIRAREQAVAAAHEAHIMGRIYALAHGDAAIARGEIRAIERMASNHRDDGPEAGNDE